MRPRVLHLSTYDAGGGAARAASSLHKALLDIGLESSMCVAHKTGTNNKTFSRNHCLWRVSQLADRQLARVERSRHQTWRSPALFGSLKADWINNQDIDVVNLHWVNDGFLSVREIGLIRKPLVWSLYDTWPLSGTEHYVGSQSRERWADNYSSASRSGSDGLLDLSRWTYNRKRRDWQDFPCRPTLVAASSWMESYARKSPITAEWPTERIPHPVDQAFFRDESTESARRTLGIAGWSRKSPLVFFLASAGLTDQRKGWDLLALAISESKQRFPDLKIAVAGPVVKKKEDYLPKGLSADDMHWFGPTQDNKTLRLMYAAADIIAVPSREDNLPLVALEAQACNRPVVAFRTGGLTDAVAPGVSGFLAEPENASDLSRCINLALTSGSQLHPRDYALGLFSEEAVASHYLELYEKVHRFGSELP